MPHSRRYESVDINLWLWLKTSAAQGCSASCPLPSRSKTLSAGRGSLEQLQDFLSIPYLNAAVDFYGLTIYEKMVLLVLANRADNKGFCFPSLKRICAEGCISRSSALRAIKSLEAKKVLTISRHHRASNHYKLNLAIECPEGTQEVPRRNFNGARRELQTSHKTIKNPLRSANRWLEKPAPKSKATPEQLEQLKAALRSVV